MPRLVLLLAATALAASACGGGESAATTTIEAAAPTATESAPGPFGEWEREVGENEIAPTPGEEPLAPGTWHLTLGPSIIQVIDASGFRISQELKVDGDALEIERYLGGDGIFCENDAASSYRWELEEDELSLTPQRDECADRKAILGATWQRMG